MGSQQASFSKKIQAESSEKATMAIHQASDILVVMILREAHFDSFHIGDNDVNNDYDVCVATMMIKGRGWWQYIGLH